jgi:hypothetical protein
MSGRTVITALAAFALALTASSAVAAGNAGSTEVFTEEIEFTFPAGTCPALPAGLSIDFTGTLRGHFHLSVDAQGVLHVNGTDSITGTAVDSDGASYRFNYHNAIHTQDAGFPLVVTITDHFNLVGNGAANQLHTFFTLRILVTGPGSQEILFHNEHGDPEHCDPL